MTAQPGHGWNNDPWDSVGALWTFTPLVSETVRWMTCASVSVDDLAEAVLYDRTASSGSTEVTIDGGATTVGYVSGANPQSGLSSDACDSRNEDVAVAVTSGTPVTLGARWTYSSNAGDTLTATLYCDSLATPIACGETVTATPGDGWSDDSWQSTGAMWKFTPSVSETVRWKTCASDSGGHMTDTQVTVDGGSTEVDTDSCDSSDGSCTCSELFSQIRKTLAR